MEVKMEGTNCPEPPPQDAGSNVNDVFPPTWVHDSSSSSTSKSSSKRKRAPKELLLRVNKDIVWSHYEATGLPAITLLDPTTLVPLICSVEIGQIDKNAIVEADKCGIFRQNQFKLQCILQGALSNYTTLTQDTSPAPHPLVGCTTVAPQQLTGVEGLYLQLYAFRQNDNEAVKNECDEASMVPLHQVGPSRTKKDTQPPELLPITNGMGTFKKLQFQASTHLSSGTHFRVVVCVMAKVLDRLYNVCASISPKIIVHARNPGRCAAKINKKPSPTPATPSVMLPSTSIATPSSSDNSDFDTSQLAHIGPSQYTPPFLSLQQFVMPQQTPQYSTIVMPTQFTPPQSNSPPQQIVVYAQHTDPSSSQYVQTPSPTDTHTTSPSSQCTYTPSPQQYAHTPSPPLHYSQSMQIPSSPQYTHTSTQQQQYTHTPSPPQQYTHTPSPPQYANTASPPQYVTPQPLYIQSYAQQQQQQQQYTPPQLSQEQYAQSFHTHTPPLPTTASLQLSEEIIDSVHSDQERVGNQEDASSWMKNGDVTYFYGRVGINTSTPQESLTVDGNIMMTGDLLKPSDMRLKDNFIPVSPALQLHFINNIKIYDYDIHIGNAQRRERGVIAQDVAKLLPAAVHQVNGESTMSSGQLLENLLVVNERMLLMENIGATQYLNHIVDEDRAEIDAVTNKLNELEQEERNNSSTVMSTMQSMASYVLSEDFREAQSGSCIHCGFSLFGLGPAWSLFVLGFLFPPAWVLGALYMTAENSVKKVAGVANFLMMIAGAIIVGGLFVYDHIRWLPVVLTVVVFFLVVVSYFRRKRERMRHKLLKSDFLEKIKRAPTYKSGNRGPTDNINRRGAKPAADV